MLKPYHAAWEIAGGSDAAIPHMKQLFQPKKTPASTSTAPKYVEQTAVHAFRESFPARRGTYFVQQLLLAADYTDSKKKAHGFFNELKQAPLTTKAKERNEIPKSYRDAGNFTNP